MWVQWVCQKPHTHREFSPEPHGIAQPKTAHFIRTKPLTTSGDHIPSQVEKAVIDSQELRTACKRKATDTDTFHDRPNKIIRQQLVSSGKNSFGINDSSCCQPLKFQVIQESSLPILTMCKIYLIMLKKRISHNLKKMYWSSPKSSIYTEACFTLQAQLGKTLRDPFYAIQAGTLVNGGSYPFSTGKSTCASRTVVPYNTLIRH